MGRQMSTYRTKAITKKKRKEKKNTHNEEWVKLNVNSCTFADFIALTKATTVRPTDMPYHGGECFALGEPAE